MMKLMAVQWHSLSVQTQPATGQCKALCPHIGPGTAALHALSKLAVVDLAFGSGRLADAVQIAHALHNVQGSVRLVQAQPLSSNSGHFPGQAQHGIESLSCPCRTGRSQHLFHIVVQKRNLRRQTDARGYGLFILVGLVPAVIKILAQLPCKPVRDLAGRPRPLMICTSRSGASTAMTPGPEGEEGFCMK